MFTPRRYSRENPPKKRKDTVLIIAGERSGEIGFVTGVDLERELASVVVLAVGEREPRTIPFSDLAEPDPLAQWFWPGQSPPLWFWLAAVVVTIVVFIPLAIWFLHGTNSQ